MRVFKALDDVPAAGKGRSLALGTFDGVHCGHRRVIERACSWAQQIEAPVTVVTFDPHPLQLLKPDDPPRLLTSTARKAELIDELGVDELVVIPFTETLSRMDPETFCSDVLASALSARHLCVGANFRFGYKAAGDAALLQSRSEFETEVVPLVQRGGETISSSRIRKLVAMGHVREAAELLCARFRLEGEVVRGDERGRTLGVPTANVAVAPELVVPGAGIYAAIARVAELQRPAAVSIGLRPTFEQEGKLLVEAHLLDFDGDLYGLKLSLELVDRLRDELPFPSQEALVEQMDRDIEVVRSVLSTHHRSPG